MGGSDGDNRVEEQLDGSSVILEAFGNAKTTRNNNSSRFGKYMSLQFDKNYAICGSEIQTYLLEKSRVVSQGEHERGYHIFYHLVAFNFENSPDEFKDFELGEVMDYFYVNQGKAKSADGINDVELFKELRHSMTVFGITLDEQVYTPPFFLLSTMLHKILQVYFPPFFFLTSLFQVSLFRILAGILHLGNIEITAKRGGGGQEAGLGADEPNLIKACTCLDINVS